MFTSTFLPVQKFTQKCINKYKFMAANLYVSCFRIDSPLADKILCHVEFTEHFYILWLRNA